MTVRRKWVGVAVALVGLPLIALGIAWAQRVPIAKSVIDDRLANKGVKASYDIKALGTKLQRIEHIVIGNPASPDLTADWAEIDTSLRFFGADIRAVRAGGVRLRGKLVDGVVTLGDVDKLLPPRSDEPLKLPDMPLELTDAQLDMETEYGALTGHVAGKGNLAHQFVSQVALSSPKLARSGCVIETAALEGHFTLDERAPHFQGPVTLAKGACGQNRAERLELTLDASLPETLDHWKGTAKITLARLVAPRASAKTLSGWIDFEGSRKDGTSGAYGLFPRSVTVPSVSVASAQLTGRFQGQQSALVGFSMSSDGLATAEGVVPDRQIVSDMASWRDKGSGTPLGQIAEALGQAVDGLSRGGRASALYNFEQVGACCGHVKLSAVKADSLSGARLVMKGETPLIVKWPSGPGNRQMVEFGGQIQLSGGGFPTADVIISDDRGTVRMAPFVAGSSRVTVTPIRLSFREGSRSINSGLWLETVATIDGPLASGKVQGLTVPINVRGGRMVLGCMPVSFRSLSLPGISLSPAATDVCVSGGTARLGPTKMAGRLGKSPVTLFGRKMSVGLAHGDFSVENLAVKLGTGSKPTLLDVFHLTGSLNAGQAGGRYSGASGRIGAVPLLMSDGQGSWNLDRGIFTTAARLTVADAQEAFRFRPVVSDNMRLRLSGDSVTATGTVRDSKHGITISNVTLSHSLSRGTGQAILDVPSLTFGPGLQPEELTPITNGVIANVVGTLNGRGVVNWTPNGATSSGVFRTNSMDLAAAFGPVTGLSGEIHLSDLLGLETPPGQQVQILAVNPGIAVANGQIGYRLLPGLRARIEGGRWPFAGGVLILDPTTLDLNSASRRDLTFRVEGMDMSRFIQTMEFENLSATGIFDGTLPMVFDKDGGRIVGGSLVARSGGTLAYVGEISNENMGGMARIAFDALKSIRYSRLSIELDGAIDGDVITRVKFAGVNQAPIQGVRAKFPIPIKVQGLNNIPFIFNVTITAQFRKLFDMTRTFSDPSLLIERLNPDLSRVGRAKTIQPSESQPVREKP